MTLVDRLVATPSTDFLVEYPTEEPPAGVQALKRRLEGTHRITCRQDDGHRRMPETPLGRYTQLEQLLALWDWRRGTVGWMRALIDSGPQPG